MTVRLSGWQKTRKGTYCFFPGGPFYSYSICQRYTRKSWPLAKEPSGPLCERCIVEMRRTVRQIERKVDSPDR